MKGFEDVENKKGRLRAAAALSLALWVMLGMLLPLRAYASDGGGGGHSFGTGDWVYGIVEGPKFIPNRELLATNSWGWIIYAPNKYDAALYVCGMEPSEVSSVTVEQRAKLSNESTGGAFYDLTTHIFKVSDGSIPSWANAELIRTLFSVEDTDYVFRLEVDDMQAVNDAKEDLQTILEGGDLNGGGGGSIDSNTFNIYPSYSFGSYASESNPSGSYNFTSLFVDNTVVTTRLDKDGNAYTYSGYTTLLMSTPFIITIENFTLPDLPTGYNGNDIMVIPSVNPAANTGTITFYLGNGYALQTATTTSTIGATKSFSYVGGTANILYAYSINLTNYTVNENGLLATGYSVLNAYQNGWISYNRTLNLGPTSTNTFIGLGYGTATNEPTIPPTQWPDTEPETPTQPMVPSPTVISITISSQPTFYFEPTITTTNNYTSTTYDGTDYSKQLKSIYDELKAFHVDNNLGLNSVLSNFGEIADGLEALGDDLDQQVSWMVTNLKTDIDTNFGELKNYLKDLFEWLADELDFTVSGGGYSDSTVVSWLKKIWSKMGSGVDTRPTDPTVDPFSALDWLLRFISTLIDGLADKASDLSEDLQYLLDNISDKFPFSIPWDVVAILTLFAGEPVAPAIDYDVPIWGDVRLEADIDLSEYDSVMEVVRPVELIAFAAYLLWLTPEVLDSMDITKGMGGS